MLKCSLANIILVSMAVFEEIETRTISGSGVLRLPRQPQRYRYFRVYFSVVRPPFYDYQNFEWFPEKGFYARISAMSSRFVISEFEMQRYNEVKDYRCEEEADYLVNPLICAISTLNQNILAIAQVLGVPPTGVPQPINWDRVSIQPDRLQIECRDDTALSVRLFGVRFVNDCGNNDDESVVDPPVSEPPPPPPFPPGLPIEEISPPYPDDEFPQDTRPFPDDKIPDEFPDLPFGEPCEVIVVTGTVEQRDRDTNEVLRFPFTRLLYGTLEGFRTVSDNTSTDTNSYSFDGFCRGRQDDGGQCQPEPFWQPIITPAGNFIAPGSFRVFDVTVSSL